LPDKAVSVLDTACARLALGQSATPPAIENASRTLDDLELQERVLTREQLIDNALGQGAAVTNRAMDVHIAALRKKLGSAAPCIHTIRGVGYAFRLPESAPEAT